jgi:hypothetical protein
MVEEKYLWTRIRPETLKPNNSEGFERIPQRVLLDRIEIV